MTAFAVFLVVVAAGVVAVVVGLLVLIARTIDL